MPSPPVEQEQKSMAPGVQITQSSHELHAVPVPLHVFVPALPPEHVQAWVAFGVQTVTQSSHAPQAVPRLLQVSVPAPMEQVHPCVWPGVQISAGQLVLYQSQPLPEQAPFTEPDAVPERQELVVPQKPQVFCPVQLSQSVLTVHGSGSHSLHELQAVPVLLQVWEPTFFPAHAQAWTLPAVQMTAGQLVQVPHESPSLAQVCVPSAPLEQAQDCVESGVQTQSTQLPQAEPVLLHV
jgi:hypothetical protein